MVNKKGVKACVLERGAMFKFPDDSRKCYVDALDSLLCNVSSPLVVFQREETLNRKPVFVFIVFYVNYQP